MSRPLRAALIAPPVALFALPLVLALPLALAQALDAAAWRALLDDPRLPRAWALSVGTALASTFGAAALAMGLVTHLHGTRAWAAVTRALAPMLALPHAAFAIGFALLVMPAGLAARLLAPAFGWTAPPDWPTLHDPWGLALVAVLVGKELPFVLWQLMALLARPEWAAQWRAWRASAQSLGYAEAALWWRVLWPLLLPRLAWSLLAVLAYGLTVVDLALVIGPTAPPTLAVLAWQALLDGDAARNAEGAAAALLLALTLAALAGLGALAWRALGPAWTRRGSDGVRRVRGGAGGRVAALALAMACALVYALVLALLAASSLAGVWTFPSPLPQAWSVDAWAQVASGSRTLALSAGVGVAAAVLSLVLVLLWLEATPAAWDARAMPFVLAPLVLPPVLLLVGLYALALRLRLDGTVTGLVAVHTLAALPYVFVALAPAWRAFDPRFEATALALGRSRAAFWWQVKRSLLAAPLAAALAVGFAVSVAQYLPTQFIGAGRQATVTTEAVTLAAGGQRGGAAAFALLQALLPALGFGAAALVGRRMTRHGA
ncbi:MAG TPA: ABC transporter permease [Burkholderiaceae bacterium]|nr:ABC transporter permease [Burkholderiaceae bacterium]